MYLDASIAQQFQGYPDSIMQLVFHPGHAQQFHVSLQALHDRRHLRGSFLNAHFGLVISILEKHKQN